jgi:hypothetical protein
MLFEWGSLVVNFGTYWSAQYVHGYVRCHSETNYAWTAFFEDDFYELSDGGMCRTLAEAMMKTESFCARALGAESLSAAIGFEVVGSDEMLELAESDVMGSTEDRLLQETDRGVMGVLSEDSDD